MLLLRVFPIGVVVIIDAGTYDCLDIEVSLETSLKNFVQFGALNFSLCNLAHFLSKIFR